MDLIVLESPNKVRDVQRYAKACGLEADVIATVGHLMDLPPMSDGPGVDTSALTLSAARPRDDAAATRVRRIKQAMASADRVIVATDPDREGEAIAAEVWGWISPGRAWRARFEEITLAGIRRGLQEMQPALRLPAVEASHTRRVIDRLAGWHGTALVFEKLRQHRGLSAGRLQSAALRLVVERHREHQAFRPSTSYGVRVRVRTVAGHEVIGTLVDDDGKGRSFETEAEARAVTLPPAARVTSVESTTGQERPRPPFESSSWLQVACKALGLSVKEATEATQTLFEAGHTTYPRTDTVRVSVEAIAWARQEIERRFGRQYVPEAPWQHKDGHAAAVQGAHEAIRPTVPHGDASEVEGRRSGRYGEGYALIEARFLASQAAARVVERTVVKLTAGDARFVLRGQVELFDGWRRVLSTEAVEESERPPNGSGPEDCREEEPLPPLTAGGELMVVGLDVATQVTKPKPLFTQAGLIAELKRLGIGRPSTYQAVVPLLLSRGWATEVAPVANRASKSKALASLVPTSGGQDLCDFLLEALPSLVDYQFTAAMEAALDEIEQGAKRRTEVAGSWWARFDQELTIAKQRQPRVAARQDLGACPKCAVEGRAGRLRLIQGVRAQTRKPYEFAGCDADTKNVRVCGHTAQVRDGSLIVPAQCPSCGAPLRAVNRKDGGRSWVCQEHGWFLAGRRWELVVAPNCPRCASPMVHRERRNPKSEFFWACFTDKVFLESDRFGSTRKSGGRGSSRRR